MGEKYWGKL